MKKSIFIISAILLILAGSFSSCGKEDDENKYDFFYTDNGEKETFTIRKDKVILKAKSEVEADALSKNAIFVSARTVDYDWVIATINPQKTKLDNLLQRTDVVSATYGLEYADGTLQYPTNMIHIKIKENFTFEEVFDVTGLTESIKTKELINENHEIYLITLNVELGDILRICRNLFETKMCEFAIPSFIREMKAHLLTNFKTE